MKRILIAFLATLFVPVAASAQTPEPRDVAVVVRMWAPGLFQTNGAISPDGAEELRHLVALTTALRSQELDELPFAFTLPGVLCDELRLVGSADAKRIIRSLQALARTHPVLIGTYSDAELAGMDRETVSEELEDGIAAAEPCTGVTARAPFVPERLSIPNERALHALDAADVTSALSGFAVPPAERRPRVVPAVQLHPDVGDGITLVGARPEATRIAAVVTHAESLRKLADDPAVNLVPISALRKEDVLGGLIDTEERRENKSALETMEASLRRFTAVTLESSRMAAIFRTVVARTGRGSGGFAVDDFTETIDGELAKVTAPDGTVTFTSQRGTVPVTVSNKTTYPVRIRIEVSSARLSFPDGAVQVVTIEPPGDTITFAALARSSGSFPMSVTLSDPRGTFVLDRAEVAVRSTAANLPAVVLTVGGAIFLVVWFGMRRRKPRRSRET